MRSATGTRIAQRLAGHAVNCPSGDAAWLIGGDWLTAETLASLVGSFFSSVFGFLSIDRMFMLRRVPLTVVSDLYPSSEARGSISALSNASSLGARAASGGGR